ncbi:hypothetical protein [uncultured Bacteroides sp.]|uniref:hypothetical protein n=1 Tax=uncultured Bacteroides sp. TaxID=162156 RepID=UPI0025E41210|nr:hypothetical protein [uncultured Bacteroides sp.]
MKYNISGVDRELAKKMQGREGKELKLTLLKKIAEQEVMLNLFEQSISHCNQQIQYCIDKVNNEKDASKKQWYETQKIVFDDNKLIWNISGFVTLISIDVKTIQVGMYFAETEWHKRFYARQICTIMYESSKDIFELLGKNFKDLISKRIDITSFELELKSIRSRLNLFQSTNSTYLHTVRNNTAAHKDQDVLNQLNIITNINWSDIMKTTMEFESIINDLGIFLQKLINSGLDNLKKSPLGQDRI